MPDNQLVSNQSDNYAKWSPQERLFYEFTQEMMKKRDLEEQLRQQRLDAEQGHEEEVQNQQGGTSNIMGMQTTANNPGMKLFMAKIKGTRPKLLVPHPSRARLPNAAQLAQSVETPIGVKKGSSGIHINPENRGKFTATQKATGKSVEELKHSSNPLTRKRAAFAQMAKRHFQPLK